MRIFGIDIARLAALPIMTARSAYNRYRPFKATLALTYDCPYGCYYCGVPERREPELSADELVSALSSLDCITWLDVSGGEIFTREDCLPLIVRLVEGFPSLALFHFPTSGSHPDEAVELAGAISGMGVKVVVSVSIEGPATLHDRVRGAGAFARAVETFVRLKELKDVSTYVGTTLLHENVQLVPSGIFQAVSRHYPELRKSDLHFNTMQHSDHYFCNASARRPGGGEVRSALRRVIMWKGLPRTPFCALELGFRTLALQASSKGFGLLPRCAALKSSFFMSPSGIVYPCHIWGEPVGKVGPGRPVRALLDSELWAWVRTSVAYGHCPLCWTPCEAYPTMIDKAVNPFGL